MNLNEYYNHLLNSITAFDNSAATQALKQQSAPNDLEKYDKYKTAVKQVAALGIEGTAPDASMATKKNNYFAGSALVKDTFGTKEYPENLHAEPPIVKAMMKEVWLDHKEKFADAEFDPLSTKVAYALSFLGYETIPQRKESVAKQAAEMRQILGVPVAPKHAPTQGTGNCVDNNTPMLRV